MAKTRAWTPCRRSARTPKRCSRRSASTRQPSSGCVATARSEATLGPSTMSRPALVFACAHLCDERLFAPQVDALGAAFDCRVFAFREHDSLAAMARALLADSRERFTLIGLSLGGYLAFEVMRRASERVERLALLDTTAAGDSDSRRAGRLADIAT